MPVRGNSSGTKIDTVDGLKFTGTEDIEYLRNRMMAALKVPASFLNYTQDVNTKSTLSAQDVRFARSVERVQKCILTELYKMAFVHLYSLGFELKDMVEFEISLTKSSKVYEMEKMLLWQSKIDLADKMIDTKLIPSKWIYQNVFDMNDEDIIELKQELINDTKFTTYLEKGLSKGQKINFRTPSQKEDRARDKGVYKQIEHDKDEQLDDFMNPEDTPTTTKSLNKLKHNFKGKSPLATDLTQHELIYQNKK
ncbi:MAG: portal protein [Candidatus Omnitrophica bacterium]|jgi:hypothetical protein|nr:portal protein [Candidatus Omnitrophota bacterium]